jgi:enoyl-CoA hydratase/carnithine racemase
VEELAMPGTVAMAVSDGVATVTWANPGRLNAMDEAIAAGLATAVAEARRRTDIGALILRGSGGEAFCSGVDLKFAEQSGDRRGAFERIDRHVSAFCAAITDLPFPSIALLHGVCYGGGVHLAAMTDFRLGDTALRLAIPAVKNSLFYPIVALERLMRVMGSVRTRRLLLEGALVPPAQLLSWGFLDELVPTDELDAATQALAARLAAQPRQVVRSYMMMFRALDHGDAAEARRLRDEARPRIGKN